MSRRWNSCIPAIWLLFPGCGEPQNPSADSADASSSCSDSCLSREAPNWAMPNPSALAWPNSARLELIDGLVVDAITGLEWQAADAGTATLADANDTCSELQLASHQDYRLPTRIELVSIVDRSRTPSISRVFGDAPADYFWSASEYPGAADLSYSVYFGLGETATGQADQAGAYVRCVRGGKRRATPRFSIETEVILDLATGLYWQRTAPTQEFTLGAAQAYCAALTLQDAMWRLPSDTELQTLVDTTVECAPWIDRDAFPSARPRVFWADPPPRVQPLGVDFADGLATEREARDSYAVRCVH